MPLIDSEGVFGMVMVATKNPRMFSEFQKHLIARMGDHLAVAVTGQRMRTRVRDQAAEIDLVNEIGQVVSSSPDLGSAFSSAEDLIRGFVPFDRFSVFSIDLEEKILTRTFVLGDRLDAFNQRDYPIRTEDVPGLRTVLSGQDPVILDRKQLIDISVANEVFSPLLEAGYQQVLIVPLVVTARPVGFVVFGSKQSDPYDDHQVSIAARIGEQVAGPVANAFLLDRTRREAEVESTLVEIGRIAGSTFDLQSTVGELGPLIRSLVDSKSILIGGIEEDQRHMRVFYVDYVDVDPEQGLAPGRKLDSFHPIKGTSSETMLKTLQPVLVNA